MVLLVLGSVAVTSSSAESISVSNLNLSGYKQVYIICRYLNGSQSQEFRLQTNHEYWIVAGQGGGGSADYGNSWDMICDLETGITFSGAVRFSEKENTSYKTSFNAITTRAGSNPNPNITTSTTTISLHTRSGYPFTYTTNSSPQNETRDMRIYGIK